MFSYKVGKYNITAKTKDEAMKVSDVLDGDPTRRIVFVYDDDTVHTIKFNTESCRVYVQYGETVDYCGHILSGAGKSIITSAVEQIDKSREFATKLKSNRMRLNYLVKAQEYDNIIDEFEGKIPDDVKDLFRFTITRICGKAKPTKAIVYRQIMGGVQVRNENWFAILQWFSTNVLDIGNQTNRSLRKAFISTCIRMGNKDLKTQNIVDAAREETNKGYWDEYVDKR